MKKTNNKFEISNNDKMKFKSLQHPKQVSYNKNKNVVIKLGITKKWEKGGGLMDSWMINNLNGGLNRITGESNGEEE